MKYIIYSILFILFSCFVSASYEDFNTGSQYVLLGNLYGHTENIINNDITFFYGVDENITSNIISKADTGVYYKHNAYYDMYITVLPLTELSDTAFYKASDGTLILNKYSYTLGDTLQFVMKITNKYNISCINSDLIYGIIYPNTIIFENGSIEPEIDSILIKKQYQDFKGELNILHNFTISKDLEPGKYKAFTNFKCQNQEPLIFYSEFDVKKPNKFYILVILFVLFFIFIMLIAMKKRNDG